MTRLDRERVWGGTCALPADVCCRRYLRIFAADRLHAAYSFVLPPLLTICCTFPCAALQEKMCYLGARPSFYLATPD